MTFLPDGSRGGGGVVVVGEVAGSAGSARGVCEVGGVGPGRRGRGRGGAAARVAALGRAGEGGLVVVVVVVVVVAAAGAPRRGASFASGGRSAASHAPRRERDGARRVERAGEAGAVVTRDQRVREVVRAVNIAR